MIEIYAKLAVIALSVVLSVCAARLAELAKERSDEKTDERRDYYRDIAYADVRRRRELARNRETLWRRWSNADD